MLSTMVYFNAITRDYSQSLARTAAEPSVSRDTQYYLDNIGKVKSIDDLLNNQRLFTYAMKAYGLEDMVNAKGLMRKVLEGGVTDSKSLANTLNDRRYLVFAAAFDFHGKGADATSASTAVDGTVDRYIETVLESDAGKQSEGTRMALYFTRVAPNLTSLYGVLADKTLLSVVQTAFGLSPSMSKLDIDTQVKMIGSQVSLADLQDPTKVRKLLDRFMANYDANSVGTASTSPTLALFVTSPGINANLLLSLANLKLGGS
jgi:hypothetical protein